MKLIYQAFITKDEDGFYNVEVPDLPGCFTCGDTYEEAVYMAADAMQTYISSLLVDGENPPKFTRHACPEGAESINVFFEAEKSYIIDGDVISAAQAAKELGVSRGRVTQMLDAGILNGYRDGRHTYISTESIKERKADNPKAGRPKATAVM